MAYSTIGRLFAVTSCKGGVGKSTVSLELAFTLAARGHSVGLFDADVYGPSLPTQLPAVLGEDDVALGHDGWSVTPLEHEGVKLMSCGWFARLWSREVRTGGEVRDSYPGRLATKLLHTTAWGHLDYLIIDNPPGTGGVAQAIAANAPLHGAVVVTTPSSLATVDVVRGVRMLQRLRVPVLALVENMASFKCGGCGQIHFPFGQGHVRDVLASIGRDESSVLSISLPIVPNASAPTTPRAVSDPSSQMAREFHTLAASLEQALLARPTSVSLPHELRLDERPHWPTEIAVAEASL